MNENLIVLAKQFDEIGCVAYKFKTQQEAVSLPDVLDSISGNGMQIVVVNCPELYMEYSPYNYVGDLRDIIDYVSDRQKGTSNLNFKFEKIRT